MYKAIIKDTENTIEFGDSNNLSGLFNGNDFELDMVKDATGHMHVIKGSKSYNVEVVEANYEEKQFKIKINGQIVPVQVKDRFDELLSKMGMEGLAAKKHKDFKAPMPGLVLDINVQPGQEVAKGDTLLVLEAMKMENIMKAAADGVVSKIEVEKGQAVEKNQILIHFE